MNLVLGMAYYAVFGAYIAFLITLARDPYADEWFLHVCVAAFFAIFCADSGNHHMRLFRKKSAKDDRKLRIEVR